MATNNNARRDVPAPAAPEVPPELSAESLKRSLGTVNAYMGSAGAEVDRLAAKAVENIARYGSQSQAAAEQAAARQRQMAAENLAAYDRLGASMGWSAQAASPGRQSVARAGQRGAEDIALLGDVNRWLSSQTEAANRAYFDQARAGVTAAAQDARRRISRSYADAYSEFVRREEERRRREEEERQRRLADPSYMRAEAAAAAGAVRSQTLASLDQRIANAKTIDEAVSLLSEKNRLMDADPRVWEYMAAEQRFGSGAGARLYGFGADEIKLSPEALARQHLLAQEAAQRRASMQAQQRLYEASRPAPGSLADLYGQDASATAARRNQSNLDKLLTVHQRVIPPVNEAEYARAIANTMARMFEGSYGSDASDVGESVAAVMRAMGASPQAILDAGYAVPQEQEVPTPRQLRATEGYIKAFTNYTDGVLFDKDVEGSIPNWIEEVRSDPDNQDRPGIKDWVPSWADMRRYFQQKYDMDPFAADRFVRDNAGSLAKDLEKAGFPVEW